MKKIDDEWRKILESESKDYCEQMSRFLLAAGYPYKVDPDVGKKGGASLVLVHRQTRHPVKGVETPLSYGERNALSLALFYSEAVKNGDALIVLDDPISSFDGVKRFALLSALFSRRGSKLLGSSLNGRFVVMLTHDPLVVHDSLRFLASRCATTAKYLFTGADGVMTAREIGAGDFQPCVRLIESRIASYVRQSDDPLPFCALAYMRQRFELSRRLTSSDLYDLAEQGRPLDEDLEREASDALAFALLSSLVHGDQAPTLRRSGDSNGGLAMPPDFVSAAEDAVNALLVRCGSGARFDFARYSDLITEKPPSYITDCYAAEGASPYEKLLLLRALLDLDGNGSACMDPYHEYVLDSAFHLGGDLVMQLDRDGFCQVPPHIQGVCDDAFKAYMKKAGDAGSEAVCS